MKAHKNMQSVAAAESLAQMWLKQAADSTEILNKTKNAHDYFSHYSILLNALMYLTECEKTVNCFVGDLPSKTLTRAVEERGWQTRQFVRRFALDAMKKVSGLQTKKQK